MVKLRGITKYFRLLLLNLAIETALSTTLSGINRKKVNVPVVGVGDFPGKNN